MLSIYQIFYNIKTKNEIDPMFIPFDNCLKDKDLWYEYNVIRKIFKNIEFKDHDYLGFFSPRFLEKTGMHGIDVISKVVSSNTDIISFSPNFSENAHYRNSFIQGDKHHPGLLNLSQKLSNLLEFNIDLENLIQDQTRIIFSNFFIAKFWVWKLWFAYADKIFNMAYDPNSIMYKDLNSYCIHREEDSSYQYKIFFMERLISLILEKYSLNSGIGLNFNNYLSNNQGEIGLIDELFLLDSLKSQYLKTNLKKYLEIYELRRLNLYH